jgi:hypothetical protein
VLSCLFNRSSLPSIFDIWIEDYAMKLFQPNRRTMLTQSACGFGSLAAAAMMSPRASLGSTDIEGKTAKAKRIIFLFMQGGVSQVDSFDFKPILAKHDGQTMPFDDARHGAPTDDVTMELQAIWRVWPMGVGTLSRNSSAC